MVFVQNQWVRCVHKLVLFSKKKSIFWDKNSYCATMKSCHTSAQPKQQAYMIKHHDPFKTKATSLEFNRTDAYWCIYQALQTISFEWLPWQPGSASLKSFLSKSKHNENYSPYNFDIMSHIIIDFCVSTTALLWRYMQNFIVIYFVTLLGVTRKYILGKFSKKFR